MWSPTDLSNCQSHDLASCSSFGYFYLSLLAKLFGKPKYDLDNETYNSDKYDFVFKLENNNYTHKLDEADKEHASNKINERKRREGDRGTNRHRSKRWEEKDMEEEYDFIVVGAGSAGCVIANRLSEIKNWKVLLLEAGDEQPQVSEIPALAPALYGSSIDWGYSTVADGMACVAMLDGRCSWPRGKVMGGSSSINSMVYLRGNRKDYDDWSAEGNYGWSYKEVLPYFKKSENNLDPEAKDYRYHSVGGYQDVQRFPYVDQASVMVLEGLKQMGLPLNDFNAGEQIGSMLTQTTSKHGVRASTNEAFIENIRHKRHNLEVKPNAEVLKILIDVKDKTAYGVKYIKYGVTRKAFARKEVIVSAGAINSPKLLMLSGIGPHKHLDEMDIPVIKDLMVGQNLQDHVTMDALPIVIQNSTAPEVNKDEIIDEIYKYKKSEKYYGTLSSVGPNSIVGYIRTECSDDPIEVPDVQFHFGHTDIVEYLTDPTEYLATKTMPMTYYDAISAKPQLLKPESRGYILLNNSNPYGPPRIYANYLSTTKDVATMIAGIKFIINLDRTPSLKKYGAYYWSKPLKACKKFLFGTDPYFECILRSYTATSYHPTSTCKMGPKWDKNAVVDPSLKVYGINHLRVADASIMPTIVRSNTNAPCIMIGEKASDMIKHEWHDYIRG